MKKRILLAGLYHETNTFLRARSGLSDFDVKLGEEISDAEGDVSPLTGALEVGRTSGWDLMPLIDLRATPGATVSDEVVERFWDALLSAAERGATLAFLSGLGACTLSVTLRGAKPNLTACFKALCRVVCMSCTVRGESPTSSLERYSPCTWAGERVLTFKCPNAGMRCDRTT